MEKILLTKEEENSLALIIEEGYKAKKSCLNGIESIRKNADSETVEE